jgi:hypothetical protein
MAHTSFAWRTYSSFTKMKSESGTVFGREVQGDFSHFGYIGEDGAGSNRARVRARTGTGT